MSILSIPITQKNAINTPVHLMDTFNTLINNSTSVHSTISLKQLMRRGEVAQKHSKDKWFHYEKYEKIITEIAWLGFVYSAWAIELVQPNNVCKWRQCLQLNVM